MEIDSSDSTIPKSGVKATFKLGSEAYTFDVNKGTKLSEQLISMKEESMKILKEFITKHNVPNDVPDELLEGSSEEEDEVTKKPVMKTKKTKLT